LNPAIRDFPSLFLRLFYNPPKAAADISIPTFMDAATKYMIRFLNESGIYESGLTNEDQIKIKKAIKEIAKKREEYIEGIGQVYGLDKRGNYFGAVVGYDADDEKQLCGFVKNYCAYLKNEHARLVDFFAEKGIAGKTVPAASIAPSSLKSKWPGFLKYCFYENKGLDLEPDENGIAGIKFRIERSARESKEIDQREYQRAKKYFESLKTETDEEREYRLLLLETDEAFANEVKRYDEIIKKQKRAI
jgi:hypothetical protein